MIKKITKFEDITLKFTVTLEIIILLLRTVFLWRSWPSWTSYYSWLLEAFLSLPSLPLQFINPFRKFHQVSRCLSLCRLTLIRIVSVKFSRSSFLVICPGNFSCLFLIFSIIVLLVTIIFITSSLLIHSVHWLLIILL